MLTIEEINTLIDDEIEYAKRANPVMALGMEQIRRKLNNYSNYKTAKSALKESENM